MRNDVKLSNIPQLLLVGTGFTGTQARARGTASVVTCTLFDVTALPHF
jgi:hypothetical protein